MDFLAPLDVRVAEQVIEVPQIVCPPRGARTVLGAPQTAEQLVEVPTPPWYVAFVLASKVYSRQELRRIIAELKGRGGGAPGGLPGSRTGQGSTANLAQIGEYPVPQVRREGGVQGSLPGQNSEIVDIPARRAPD